MTELSVNSVCCYYNGWQTIGHVCGGRKPDMQKNPRESQHLKVKEWADKRVWKRGRGDVRGYLESTVLWKPVEKHFPVVFNTGKWWHTTQVQCHGVFGLVITDIFSGMFIFSADDPCQRAHSEYRTKMKYPHCPLKKFAHLRKEGGWLRRGTRNGEVIFLSLLVSIVAFSKSPNYAYKAWSKQVWKYLKEKKYIKKDSR